MFPINSVFVTNTTQELFILASFLKRLPCSQVIQLCRVATKSHLNKETKGDNLPFLPVQPLEQTIAKYVRSVKPFVDSSQFEKVQGLAKKFCEDENLGKKLQKLLQERAANTTNWASIIDNLCESNHCENVRLIYKKGLLQLEDWWLTTAYLEYRNPVIVYSSPGLVWPEKKFKDQKEQLIYTAQLISAALDFNQMIEQDKIPQEKLQGRHVLCMSQYRKIFGSCRVPKTHRDELVLQDSQNPSHNIIVLYNNHLFSLPVFEKDERKPLSDSHFYAMLLDIVTKGNEIPGLPIGVLTTENRDNWAKAYQDLKSNKMNKQMLEEHVEKALFVVCLENPLSVGSGLNYMTRCSKLLIHGFGHRGNAGNRWYDKTVQFIVGAYNDGLGITYEHSPAEGGPIGVLTDFVVEKTKVLKTDLEIPLDYPKPQKLELSVSDSVKKSIESAKEALDKICDDLDVFGWSFSHFGKKEIKNFKVSPDSFIQIGIQLAYYKIHKHPGAQYESGSLRKFAFGRTDVIRTCSEEVVNFCQTITSFSKSKEEKEKALRAALAYHRNYTQDVIEGRGIDRHLLGLKILAELNNIKDAAIFSDEAYQRSTHFHLSTSNVPTACDAFMVYGPLVDDGYACCYNPRPNNINFGTTAWSCCRQTRLNAFKEALEEALIDMRDCLSNSETKSKL